MIIHIDECWRIRSDVRSWQIEELQGKSRRIWRAVAWVNTLERARRYLLRRGVCPSAFAAVEETLECRDPFDPDGKRGFCWQFDEVFPAESPEARSLAKMTVRVWGGVAPEVDSLAVESSKRRKTPLPEDTRLERASSGGLVIRVGSQWRIREAPYEWYVEKFHRKKTPWEPEAYCANLLDAMNTLLQRRIWLIEGDDPRAIITERETIRQEILSAWQTVQVNLEAA
ncbi:MAG TPA: hypothetical protein PLQ35_16170 [bacterium]|nr:hypothetical protein [bacterium]HQL63815.1 hypothetical protein [bacterium]